MLAQVIFQPAYVVLSPLLYEETYGEYFWQLPISRRPLGDVDAVVELINIPIIVQPSEALIVCWTAQKNRNPSNIIAISKKWCC
jgi:hypothetical protein